MVVCKGWPQILEDLLLKNSLRIFKTFIYENIIMKDLL